MLVTVHVGRDAGAVRDIRAAEARMMLADGRASLPVADEVPMPTVVSTHVVARTDRVAPRGKHRSTR